MRCVVFGTRSFDRTSMEAANAGRHELEFLDVTLSTKSAGLADGSPAACICVNDTADRAAIERLAESGVRVLALRSAGFNHVDLDAAAAAGLTVLRVPAYSPHAVAEHAVAMILTLNRKIHRAYNRVREHNFALEGLMGFDLHGKTVGVVGTGKIGQVFCRIMSGFGCRVLASDPNPDPVAAGLGAKYVPLPELLAESDVVSLHCPLTPQTRHMIDATAFALMRPGAMLVNTSRGAVVDTRAAVKALKPGRLGALGLDVYEEEEGLFFKDLSETVLHDDLLARLLTFPNVLVTAHQAFFTHEAVANIAETTIGNLTAYEDGSVDPANVVDVSRIAR